MTSSRAVVAIDGPSGSGKSSTSRGVAKALGLEYLDTGAMYRAMAWFMLDRGVDVTDPDAVAARVAEPTLTNTTDPDAPTIAVDGVDVSEPIRGEAVTGAVSPVATVPAVRAKLVELQRAVVAEAAGRGRGIVVEGRDIGSVVLPDATAKIYLSADPAARAARRALENAGRAGNAGGGDAPDDAAVAATAASLAARDAIDSGRAVSPLTMAEGAVHVDGTHLSLDEVIEAVVAIVRAAEEAQDADASQVDAAGWISLGDVDPHAGDGAFADAAFDDADFDEEAERAALAAAAEEFGIDLDEEDLEVATRAVPVVAVIGRPNVGKSTLVNRILGRREAVVQDVPGVTRDRVSYDADWSGHRFQLVDTGGWDPDAQGMAAAITAQAERAVALADVVVLVVDATVGATDAEEAVVRVLRQAGKPVVLAANKVDDERTEADAAMLWSLGLGEPHAVSALHGRGSGDLLDAVLAEFPDEGSGVARQLGPRRVALVGRPNVGKSSLLNKLAGAERAVVSEVAGTTVDPVDEVVVLRDREWLFVDTAGIRRRVRVASGHEYYASLRTHAALEKAEVAVVLVDGGEPMSEQDLRITSMVVETGRALVLAINKWDLVDEERRRFLEREIERDLAPIAWAPRVNVSARTGRAVDKLVPALDAALAGWETRVSTGRLNQFLKELVAAHPHPLRGGKQPRILFGTQAASRPPTFVLFSTGFLEAGYRRFVERRLREEFGFVGTPIRINLRIREKRGANR